MWDTSIFSFILSKEEQNNDRSREEKQNEEKKRPESEGVNDGLSANIPFLLNTNCVT